MLFQDRSEAGRLLASLLEQFANHPNAIVLALPRGGVPVGFEIAEALNLPLDVCVVRKLGVPGQEELAMGAIASGGVRVLNEGIVNSTGVSATQIEAVAATEERELRRREHLYRGNRPPIDVAGRVAILVDDGLATGSTMRAAAAALRRQHPAQIIVAVPVAASPTCDILRAEVDQVICAATPEPFYAVGQWYKEFGQTSDDEVRTLLDRAAERVQRPAV